jgi:hypothetical protein
MLRKFFGLGLYALAIVYAVAAYVDDDRSAFLPIIIVLTTTPLVIGMFYGSGKNNKVS